MDERFVLLQGLGLGHGCPFCTTINVYKICAGTEMFSKQGNNN